MADNKIPDVIRFGFKDFVINEAKQSSSAKCSACKAVIHEKVGTTSAYTRHLSTSAHQGLRLRYEEWKTSETKVEKQQPLMTQFTTTKKTYAALHPRQRELQNAVITHLIVSGNLPLNTVERPWFQRFMAIVDPMFSIPCRRKVTSVLGKMYDVKRSVLQSKLMSVEFLSLTLDMWSDRRMRSFMGVTVHFLTAEMKFESYLLDMGAFDGSHTGEQIGAHCVSLLEEFKIREKVCFIVTDNAANMIRAFRAMGELLADPDNVNDVSGDESQDSETEDDHTEGEPNIVSMNDQVTADLLLDGEEPVSEDTLDQVLGNLENIDKTRLPCGIHTLQLVAIDGLKEAKFLSGVMSKTCKLATLIHTSGVFSEAYFKEFKTTIPSTTNTRWNSVFLQLQAMSKVDATKLQILLTDKKHQACMLTPREFAILNEAITVLEPAYNATLVMEDESALVSLIAPTVTALHKTWKFMSEQLVYSRGLALGLLNSLERRFRGLIDNLLPLPLNNDAAQQPKSYPFDGGFGDLLYPVSAALDPDFKLNWLDDWERDHDPNVKARVTAWTVQYAKTAIDQQMVAERRRVAQRQAAADDRCHSSGTRDHDQRATDETSAPLSKKAKLFPFLVKSSSASQNPTVRPMGCVDDIKEQVLKFTYDTSVSDQGLKLFNDSRFCSLKPLAMKLFTAPASSASSERVFSKAGLLIRPTRSRLSKSSLSKLVFLSCNDGQL